MGETGNQPFQLSFNAALKIEFQGSRVTSDGGLILVRELDERLGFSDLIAQHITDPRGKNSQFPLADLIRQSVYRRLAGYEDVNDAEPLLPGSSRPVSYRISFTFEQDPEGEEALGQMAAPLTVECTTLRESGETNYIHLRGGTHHRVDDTAVIST